jgi:hypothetical protein
MDLTLRLSSEYEDLLEQEARREGITPDALAARIVERQLAPLASDPVARMHARLRAWQEKDGVRLFPDTPASALFARWDEESAGMTDEERECEERIWDDVVTNLQKRHSEPTER